MPKYNVRFLPEAVSDLEKIADYNLIMVGKASSERIVSKILDAIEILSDYPNAGPVHPDELLGPLGYRKLVLTDIYVAVYRVISDEVFIYRIVNGKTDYPKLI